jgi:hypothetical protein
LTNSILSDKQQHAIITEDKEIQSLKKSTEFHNLVAHLNPGFKTLKLTALIKNQKKVNSKQTNAFFVTLGLLSNFYWVLVSVTSQLKVVMVPVFDAAVNVRVAWIDAPAARTVLCRFQDNVSEEPAPLGVQLPVVMVNVSATLPVFLT